MRFFTQTLPHKTAELIEHIKSVPELKSFYLSGGTALSLQLGHRESEDLDFFSLLDFKPEVLQAVLLKVGTLESVQLEKGTLNVFLNDVKLQFLHYPYSMLEEFVEWNNLRLSSVIDIACTKLITISSRGSKKDFIDLYIILKNHTLVELFEKLDKKYKGINYNHVHILKSMIYFDDADTEPIPKMHTEVVWEDVKKNIEEKVKAFSL